MFCLNCKTPSRTKDPFSDISLHVPDYKPIENELEPPQEDLLTGKSKSKSNLIIY